MVAICLVGAALFVACNKLTPSSMEVLEKPKKLTVVQGGEPDLTGGTVLVTYENATTKEVPMTELTTRGLHSETLGKQTLVLVYSENKKMVSCTLEVSVVAAKATSLTLTTEGVKTDYVVGDSFKKENLVVVAHLETGEDEVAENYQISPTVLSLTTTAVKITCRGASQEIPVTVEEKAPRSMSVTSPAKTAYFSEETFLPEGITATVTYNDGAEESFPTDRLEFLHVGGGEYLFPVGSGDNRVRVVANTSFGTIEKEITLSVTEVIPVSLTPVLRDGLSLTFFEDGFFSFPQEEGAITVTVKYNNDTEETLPGTEDYFCYGDDPLPKEQTSVRIWFLGYESVTCEIPIAVVEPTLVSVSVQIPPQKKDYRTGESIDLGGLILSCEYSDGNRKTVAYQDAASEITADPSLVDEDTHVVEVIYRGMRASFEIFVG